MTTRFGLIEGSQNLYGIQFLESSFPPGTSEGSNNFSFVSIDDIKVVDFSSFLNMSFYSTDGVYTSGYNNGYYNGKNDGYSEGLSAGRDEGYNKGYEAGKDIGYSEGISANTDAFDYFNAIITAPVDAVLSMFDVDFMGWNLKGLLGFVVCGAIVVMVLKVLL